MAVVAYFQHQRSLSSFTRQTLVPWKLCRNILTARLVETSMMGAGVEKQTFSQLKSKEYSSCLLFGLC